MRLLFSENGNNPLPNSKVLPTRGALPQVWTLASQRSLTLPVFARTLIHPHGANSPPRPRLLPRLRLAVPCTVCSTTMTRHRRSTHRRQLETVARATTPCGLPTTILSGRPWWLAIPGAPALLAHPAHPPKCKIEPVHPPRLPVSSTQFLPPQQQLRSDPPCCRPSMCMAIIPSRYRLPLHHRLR